MTEPSTRPFSPLEVHTIRSSGTCSVIVDSHWRCDHRICAFQATFSGDFCSTCSTFFMKDGNSVNWVHWS